MARFGVWFAGCWWFAVDAVRAAAVATILAGGECDLPTDSPSQRLDPDGADSAFNAVGGLQMISGGRNYLGSGTAISREWVLTAGHNVDFNDDGQGDPGLSVTFHLPGFGVFGVNEVAVHPAFTGFANPSLHHDLALLRLDQRLPGGVRILDLGAVAATADVVTLAGYGRSGFGSYGYTTSASLTNRRIGFNTLETIKAEKGGSGQLFRYTFHDPDDLRSLGNDRETIIGPGDSGGPVLVERQGGPVLAGVSTFTEGFGGRFGDVGGGVLMDDETVAWVEGVTGIPEPGGPVLLMIGLFPLLLWRGRG